MKKYLKLLRVHHYIKNLLIFFPLACSGMFFEWDKLSKGLLAFLAFCFVSSAVYIVNDIRDRERDRAHPVKCKRPIAAGEISVKKACVIAAVMFLGGLAANAFLCSLPASVMLLAYCLLNVGYSFGLKNVPLLDIAILAFGFLLRIVYGAASTGIELSNWLSLTVIAMAFYFAFGKRRNELKKQDGEQGGEETRKVLRLYSYSFLDKSMYMCLAIANVFYALWSMDENTIASYGNNYIVWTVPVILLICFKYSMDIEGESDGDPVRVLLHDKVLILLLVFYILVMFLLLYVF